MTQQTSRFVKCDQCGKEARAEIDSREFNRYLNVDTHWLKHRDSTFGISASWDFCTWECLRRFATDKQKDFDG